MNYFDYINSVEPNPNLKDKTRNRVQEEIEKKNISVRKKKVAYLSTAACFAMFVTAVAITNSSSNTPNITLENPTNNAIISSTQPIQTTNNLNNNDVQADPTQNNDAVSTEKPQATVTQKPSTQKLDVTNNTSNNIIKINVASDGNKYGAQKIKIGDKVYIQYCLDGKKAEWGDDNGNLTIEKEDIGDLVCTLNADKLIDMEHWYDYSAMSSSQAKESKFNNAKIYEYKKCKNGTQLLAKTDSDYYLFYLSDFTTKVTASQVIDIYSASGSNAVKKIEVNNSFTIKDQDKITAIFDALKSSNNNCTLTEIISKGYGNENEKFNLVFTFEDGTYLKANIYKNYFAFSVVQKSDYGYYNLSSTQYDSLSKLLNK